MIVASGILLLLTSSRKMEMKIMSRIAKKKSPKQRLAAMLRTMCFYEPRNVFQDKKSIYIGVITFKKTFFNIIHTPQVRAKILVKS